MSKAPRVLYDYTKEFERNARRIPGEGFMTAIIHYYSAIEQEMERQGVTRAELARRAQLRPSYVSRVLNNPENITLRTAFRLCHALDLQLDFAMKPYPDPLYSEPKPTRTRARQAPAKPARPAARKQSAAV